MELDIFLCDEKILLFTEEGERFGAGGGICIFETRRHDEFVLLE